MKYINSYKLFESNTFIDNIKEDITFILSDFFDNWDMDIKYYKSNEMSLFNPFYKTQILNSGGFSITTKESYRNRKLNILNIKDSLLQLYDYCDIMNLEVINIELLSDSIKRYSIDRESLEEIKNDTYIIHIYIIISTSISFPNLS